MAGCWPQIYQLPGGLGSEPPREVSQGDGGAALPGQCAPPAVLMSSSTIGIWKHLQQAETRSGSLGGGSVLSTLGITVDGRENPWYTGEAEKACYLWSGFPVTQPAVQRLKT